MQPSQQDRARRYFNEMALHALTVLRIATLEIAVRRAVVAAVISRQRPGMTVLLSAASGQAFSNDYEVSHAVPALACASAPACGGRRHEAFALGCFQA